MLCAQWDCSNAEGEHDRRSLHFLFVLNSCGKAENFILQGAFLPGGFEANSGIAKSPVFVERRQSRSGAKMRP